VKHENTEERQNILLGYLARMPRRMLSLHGSHNLIEFVLYDLCHERCFNFSKAAFFIDNPDFNCTKGVVGFARTDFSDALNESVQDPQKFSDHMQSSSFNQQVRSISHGSIKSLSDSHDEVAQKLSSMLGFSNYGHCNWGMKHENHGFLLYEKADVADTAADEHLLDGLSLLSFCPIF
jgi:hypothetical protein